MMKHLISVALLCAVCPAAALAGESVLPLSGPGVVLEGAVWKSMNVRFSESFAKGRLPGVDKNDLRVTELPDGKICFQDNSEGGIDVTGAAMADVARPDNGDFCVPRTEVSARYVPVEAAGAPPSPFYSLDPKACHWSWKEGKGIGMWYEDCAYDGASWKITYDDKLDGFTGSAPEDTDPPYAFLRQFRKAGGPEALLPDLKKQGLVADTAECKFQTVKDLDVPLAPGWTAWEVAPTGKLKEAFDATPDGDMPEPPCGDLGLAVDYMGFFIVQKDHPDRVIYVDLGQDVSPIDLPSITLKD